MMKFTQLIVKCEGDKRTMELTQFIEQLKLNDVILNDEQLQQFERYFELLVEWNEKMDLTTIVEHPEVYLKHFYDSITPSFYYNFKQKITICDVGAGAGFPSIPLKICYPELNVTIVDSLKKRMTFLTHLIDELNLENVQVIHSRAEDFGQNKKYRESFDLVIARAVARTSVLSELCLPLCKQGGLFIAMKGTDVKEELNDAKKAIKTFGGKLSDTISLQLPFEKSERTIVMIDKINRTPKKYPRKSGTPQRNPIL